MLIEKNYGFVKRCLKLFNITLGAFIMAFGVNVFLVPENIAAGGVSGISTIFYIKWGVPLGLTYLMLNMILFIFGYKALEKKSFFLTVYATLASSVFFAITQGIDFLLGDVMLSSIYGGILSGLGMGLVIINGASTGGVDLLSVIINKKNPRFSVPSLILVIDFVVVFVSSVIFRDYSLILYAFVTLFATNKIMDYILDGVNFAKSAIIITDKHKELAIYIMKCMNRGVTGIYTKGMYKNIDRIALMCIVRKREVHRLKQIVKSVDRNAFVILSDVTETLGKGFKKEI